MGCVVSQSGFIAAQNPVTSSVSCIYKRSTNKLILAEKKSHFKEPAGDEIIAMLPPEGRPSLTRDGSCVFSALLGDAHTHTVHMHAMYVFLCGMHVCVCVGANKS